MVRKILAAMLGAVLLAVCAGGTADVVWPEDTEGQRVLKEYAETANQFLIAQGEPGINCIFDRGKGFVIFGITDNPEAGVPDQVEMTAKLYSGMIDSLEVRVSDFSRFPRIAASFILALSPESMTLDQALTEPTRRMQKAAGAPENSFEDQAEALNGPVPYIYYGYYPNQYHDGVNWLQMNIVFPLDGQWDGRGFVTGSEVTKAPDDYSDHSEDYEGYDSEDDYVHYEVFTTPTPEPDSAAAEYDFR